MRPRFVFCGVLPRFTATGSPGVSPTGPPVPGTRFPDSAPTLSPVSGERVPELLMPAAPGVQNIALYGSTNFSGNDEVPV